MTPETLKQLLMDYGLSPNKTFGQHFLMDEIVLQDMLDVAEVSSDDVVVEVGPGIGNLTKFLIDKAGSVISIEKDPQFINVLNSLKKKNKNFKYVLADILETDMDEVLADEKSLKAVSKTSTSKDATPKASSPEYKVVANIPYYVTGKIVQYFLKQNNKPKSLTLLMQKEVAENLTAKEGSLNLLAISVQLYADVKLVEIVPARKFYPAPKVNSAVVHIDLLKKPKFKIDSDGEKRLFKILRACFTGKRKQIHNTLTNNFGIKKEVVQEILQKLKLDPQLRPQQLSIAQWIALASEIEKLK